MDISTLTIEQLKALGYDQFLKIQQSQVLIQQSQANISLIQAEIEKRKGQAIEVKDE
jgi:hypothetical protein